MDIEQTEIDGVFLLRSVVRGDSRGRFVKNFHEPTFAAHGLTTEYPEQYWSVSQKNVVRGMHFQTPPHDHDKLVSVVEGEVYDVALDLRASSPTFGKHVAAHLSSERGDQIYIPKGFAHGFCVLSEEATVLYNVSTVYAPENDTGLLWSSVGIDWPVNSPILSDRDLGLPEFNPESSPFM